MIKFIDLKKQYLSIKTEIDEAISKVINESAFVGGKYVKEFENNFALYQQAKYCVGVGNGTDALEIAIEALDLPSGSEIIVPANSFIASAEAVSRTGHKIVFCDVNPIDYTIDMEDLRKRITDKTSAIIVVHLYGHPCDMDPILGLAKNCGLKIIEDCAQAHGAEYKGKRVGAIGDIGTFSFYPGKNLGAYGDAGAIISNDDSVAVKCRMLANHGRIAKYDHEFEGRNSRLDGLQAAILDVKLKHLEKWTEHRISIAGKYIEQLEEVEGIVLPISREWARAVYHLFVIRVKNRNKLRESLLGNQIQSGVHYPIALTKLKAFQYLKQYDDNMIAEILAEELISLPIDENVNVSAVEQVSSIVKKFQQS